MTHLQRLVLEPLVSVVEGGQRQIEELFSRVIFPMLDDLLRPTVYARDPAGMAETRLRASTFLCKAFMHFEVRENNQADIRVLWIQVLDLLDRLMHAHRRDQMVRGRSLTTDYRSIQHVCYSMKPFLNPSRMWFLLCRRRVSSCPLPRSLIRGASASRHSGQRHKSVSSVSCQASSTL